MGGGRQGGSVLCSLQPIAILFGASFTVAVSFALGSLILGDSKVDAGMHFVTGAAALSLAVFCLCAAQFVWPAVFVGLGLAILITARPKLSRPTISAIPRALIVAVTVYLALYFFNAMAPEISFDGSRYHLGLVGRYLRDHGFHRITDDLYASLSQGVEMLFLFAYSFGRHSAAEMVHFAFLIALAWMVFRYSVRIGWPIAGASAALLVFASPLAGVDGISAYNDVAVAAIAFALFSALETWDGERNLRLLAGVGVLAGFAYATKYTAWTAAPYALGYVAWRSRRLRDVAVVALCIAVMVVPWMAKDWVCVRNPVAPFFNQWFRNPYITETFETDYRHQLATQGIASRWEIPMQVTTYGSLSGLLGPVFLLSPLALVALRRREGRRLLFAAAIFGVTYPSNISARFLLAPLPFVALAMMLALATAPRVAIAIALVHSVLSWPSIVRRYAHPDAWHLWKVPYREALRIKPEDGFLRSNLPLYAETRMVEETTPPGSTIFTLTPIPEAYTTRNILVAYQSAANIHSRMTLWTAFVPVHSPTWRLHFAFERRPLRGIRIVQTASGSDSWSIHELRLAVPRDSWHLKASPYPWGIEAIVDNRPITFWTCGQTLHPGQFVEADFDAEQTLESAVIETAPNQPGIQLELYGLDLSGQWSRIAGAPQISDAPAPADLRPEAVRELRHRGIDYLLLFDGEFGADDFREHPDLWGVKLAGEYKGARLYQLP